MEKDFLNKFVVLYQDISLVPIISVSFQYFIFHFLDQIIGQVGFETEETDAVIQWSSADVKSLKLYVRH